MSPFDSLGMGKPATGAASAEPPITKVMIQRPLDRVLAFTRRTIDDVVNSPIAKNEVYGYFKLQRLVERRSEIVEMERAWNPLGLRG